MITDLPKNTAVAEPNVYTWSEELPDGYTVTVSDPDEMGITTLTNTHTPDTIEASVEKTWDDNDDQDGEAVCHTDAQNQRAGGSDLVG